MKRSMIATALLATMSSAAFAGGPLYLHEPTGQPYKWDTSKGPIPVYTDGGRFIEDKNGNLVQTYSVIEKGSIFNHDITLPDGTFIPAYTKVDRDMTYVTIDKANEATTRAIAEWSNVETSTFEMTVQGTIEEQIGIADINGSNYQSIYDKENGYGFWVTYDTDGGILENYFGVSRDQVLGIAFPEWADEETGEIIEATALMNGYFVDSKDPNLDNQSGVFTHEFGHAINMSHSQANGHIAYMARPWSPQYDGVPGCSGTTAYHSSTPVITKNIETMFPFIDVRSHAGFEQSSVNVKDDIVNISDLYPTAEYKTQYGSISGTLRTKEGVEYSGVNIVARNLDNPYEDVITQQSGNLTQGNIGPDGTFTINGLTPGARYALYVETIKAGGYPTMPTSLVSTAEYWNESESTDPSLDGTCDISPIVAQAGETTEADIYFNGYTDGIQYTPLVQAFVIDHSKNGKRALGTTQTGMIFMYDSTDKSLFKVPTDANGVPMLNAASVAMNKTATKAAGITDFDNDGVQTPAVWDIRSNKITPLEDPSNGTCTLGGSSGVGSASIWDMADDGNTVVGNVRRPQNEEVGAVCADGQGAKSVGVPAIWKKGKIEILDAELNRNTAWLRADRISGNGETVTGMTNGFGQIAWVNGELRDTYSEFGASNSSVISADGRYVAFNTLDLNSRFRASKGVEIWDTQTDTLENIGSLRWCDDVAYISRFRNLCELGFDHESLVSAGAGLPNMTVLDANDDLSMILVRAGGFLSGGFTGGIYIKDLGWMSLGEFFGRQGVVEASQILVDNPFGVSANGSELFGGLAGAQVTFDIDMNKAFVCENGVDMELSFPKQVVQAVKQGAEFGRCAHLNDKY